MARAILLTGGCGFIGSNFVRFLMDHTEDHVINLDALTYSGNPENLRDIEEDPAKASRYTFVHGNILDMELVEDLISRADAIVHMAAESHVDRSIQDGRPFVESNVLGTMTLLDALRRVDPSGLKRFVHVSTDEVYGDLPIEKPELKFSEETPISPSSPYSASKAGSDILARAYHHTFGCNICVTNCSNNFGPYQYPEKVIPLFVSNLIEGKKVPLYGDGRNIRDWIHVDDHNEAVLKILDQGVAGETYCIGGNNEHSNLELTRMVLEIMGKDESWVCPVEDRLGHDRRYAIDTMKMKHCFGWQPSRSAWPEALEATVRWYSDNRAWWEPLKNGAKPFAAVGRARG